jgi:hypothetical protein
MSLRNSIIHEHGFFGEQEQFTRMVCPFDWCEGVPHLIGASITRPPGSSGLYLTLQHVCEEGHKFATMFEDHSGGTWISAKVLDSNAKEEEESRA